MTDMSLLGRVGALLRSELIARLRVRRRETMGSRSGRRPTGGEPPVPPQDPELTRYYANLELPYGAQVDAVRAARRRLLKRYHPDLHSADPAKKQVATQLAQGLNRAHDELVSRLDRKQR